MIPPSVLIPLRLLTMPSSKPLIPTYWLAVLDLPWAQVTEEEFIQAERGAGFRPKPGCGPVATGGFGAGVLHGAVTYNGKPPS